jgi:hypothetical protein
MKKFSLSKPFLFTLHNDSSHVRIWVHYVKIFHSCPIPSLFSILFLIFSIFTILLPLSCFQYPTIFTLRCSLQATKNTAAKIFLNCRKTQRILLKGQNAASFLRCQTSDFVTLWKHAEGIIRTRH